MDNINRACVAGFLKRASDHGFSEKEAVELLKQANPLGALRGVLGQAARHVGGAAKGAARYAGGAAKDAGKDVMRAFFDNPNTAIAAKQLINSADKIVPEGLESLNNLWAAKARNAGENLSRRAVNTPPDSLRRELLDGISRVVAGVPTKRILDSAHSSLLNSYGANRRNVIDMLRRQGVDLNVGKFRPPSPPPTPAQNLINRIRLGLGRLGDLGTTVFPGAAAPINVSVG
jgi:hypothetical protein